MTIEILEKGSESFYKETINAAAQYRYLLKNHHYKLKDYFKQYKRLLITCIVLVLILALMIYFWGSDPFTISGVIVLIFAAALCVIYLFNLNRALKTYMADPRSSVLTLDDKGVELNKGDEQILRFSWDNVVFVRIFQDSIGFISDVRSGILIMVSRDYEKDILAWLSENQPGLDIAE